MEMQALIKRYKDLEKLSHVTFDDVLSKITQEVWELIEAILSWNTEEVHKEAGDVIVNIFSAAEELWVEIDMQKSCSEITLPELPVLMWKWNSKIQWLRKRYSRETISLWEVQSITSDFIQAIMQYSNPHMNLYQILEKNTEKLETRKDLYKPKIDVKEYIWSYSNFPKAWIHFKDISPILASREALRFVVLEMAEKCRNSDVIVWLDARWFIFWSLVAKELWKPFVMLRKKWKLPWETSAISYWLEYGKDTLEIQKKVIQTWQKVSIIDDLLATGGTVKAAIDLVEWEGWKVQNLMFVISLDEEELTSLDSRKKLHWYQIESLVSYN